MNETADYHTVYTCLEPHSSLGVSQELYKLISRLRLVAKHLSLELRASTLVLELEWVYQSSGQPIESQWMGYSFLYRPQPPNPAVGKRDKTSIHRMVRCMQKCKRRIIRCK